jgi:hypothetical protein
MKFLTKQVKRIAWFLLSAMVIQMVTPGVSYALTSGPSQPETQGFQPIGNSDMVDLFSGDFSYNIALMSVGEYPINLSYHSGASMDEEASWVGTGWSLNVGSLNRQLRGIPDDFNGTDTQERQINTKDHITKGGRFSMELDLLGIPKSKIKAKAKKKKKLNLSLTVSVGVKVDNYRGIGMEIGLNPGVSLTSYSAGSNTADKQTGLFDLEKGETSSVTSPSLTLSSMDGATIDVNTSILNKLLPQGDKVGVSRSIGFGYNSRSGLQGMTLRNSYSSAALSKLNTGAFETSSFISFNSDTYSPTIDHPRKSDSYTFSVNLGPELFVAFPGVGLTGFYSKQRLASKIRTSPVYGYLHSEKGRDNNEAVLDFNREKDIPYTNEVKYLPIPVPTYDLFNASSQDGSGQYHLYRGSSGVYFDQRTENKNSDFSLGVEVGGGAYFDVGVNLYKQSIKSVSQKWKKRNNYLPKGDFQGPSVNEPLYEPAYFKKVGESVPYDPAYVSIIKGVSPVAVQLPSRISNAIEGAEASDRLRTKATPDGESESTNVLKRAKREVRNTNFNYLTAKEAANHGLDKIIKDYDPDSLVLNNCNPAGVRNTFNRVSDYRKGHHFSEITITGDDGKRSVFGLPSYNTYQEEVTFSIPENLALRNKGLINYNSWDNSMDNENGKEYYFSKEKTAPYATSYLLTAILSPDYVDMTDNGVTDDDLGAAVKFNYSKLPGEYKWRTPSAFGPDTANYNEGFLSDRMDDKANYVYGTKEVWYLHSIESKAMVAHFITEDRIDGLGVTGSSGAVDTTLRLKRLKEIRLYSKSDLILHGNDPSKTIPFKVVHFVYDYSLCKGLPNNINMYRVNGNEDESGKLTLKQVYFTFGQNEKGRLAPYDFEYDTSYNFYTYRQYDRWGNFKDVANNPGGLNNSEFPYTLQDTITNHFVSAWQLRKITLPSGGSINVTYESDDYAFVQDKRASQMCMLNGVGSPGSGTGLVEADYVYVNLPHPVTTNQELKERYFEGIENIYYKFFMNLDGNGHYEFVPGYAEIDPNVPPVLAPSSTTVAKIKIKRLKKFNPMARAGWQFLRTNLPKYAYPGSENLDASGSDVVKTLRALVAAFASIKELVTGFEKRAKNKGFSNTVNLSKSWLRLGSPTWKKMGGGSRVKRIDISDDWATMSGADGAQTATYTQVFDYTTKDRKGRTISSGVASYEPMLGNDENPFRQPVRYKQKQFLGLNNYYYIEEPFGESFFPAATVGYSKVTAKTIGSGDDESVNRTGVTVSEFYTAKDYPTRVSILGLQDRKPITSKLFKLIGGVSYDVVGLSQGYSVTLNDMHGKPRVVNIFNKANQNISSVEYFYQSVNEKVESRDLRNNVKVIRSDGSVSDGYIGMDVEMFTDMREETTDNLGVSVKVSGGSGALLFFPLPFFFPGIGVNYDRRSFRSSSTIKVIQQFAIQYKTKQIQNGSSITTENQLWDAETGNVLLTKSQNEFDDPIYSFAYPAHWKYEGMGQAYRNLGTILIDFSTNSNGEIQNSTYNSILVPGDELIDINSSAKYWIINSPLGSVYQNRLINADGAPQAVTGLKLKLLRSGRRNMATTAIATINSLKSPIVGNSLDVTQLIGILDARATVFKEEWSVPIQYCLTCPSGYSLSDDKTYCYKDTIPATVSGCFTICAGDQIDAYGWAGTYIFEPGYSVDGTGTTDTIITQNPFWVGDSCIGGFLERSAAKRKTLRQGNQKLKNTQIDSSWKRGRGNLKKSKDTEEMLRIGDSCGMSPSARGTVMCGPLNRVGIWSCEGSDGNGRTPYEEWLGFSVCIDAPSTKTYYLGIASDNYFRFRIDGALKLEMLGYTGENFNKWFVFPIELVQGRHYIEFEAMNQDGPAAFGAELYDNTAAEIAAATDYSTLDTLFSTQNMIGQSFELGHFVCPQGYSLSTCDSPLVCRQITHPNDITINPYATGMKGNWRSQSQYEYHVNRENLASVSGQLGSTNIRKSGAYSVFNPFWKYQSAEWKQNPTNDQRWITTTEVTYFNSKGSGIESRDALNRYSSALFGYLESMPVAVASNARNREIGYDGFEDYGFILDCTTIDTCKMPGHFNFRRKLNGSTIDTTGAYSHTGKYSLKLNGTVELERTVYLGEPETVFFLDVYTGRYKLGSNNLAKGFSPIPGKKYLLSFWVKDGSPRNPSTTIQVSVNGLSLIDGLAKWPIVEGWKRIELPFILPVIATEFSLELQSGSTVYIDDVRIHPYEAQMKTYAYDPSSTRLAAELDENNFASFYEYNDEGILIRLKKETERGIMTIKETRSGYRKR